MAELYDMETGTRLTEQNPETGAPGQPVDPTKLKARGFEACCGAMLLVGFYPDVEKYEQVEDGKTYKDFRYTTPEKYTFPKIDRFCLAVTNPAQNKNAVLMQTFKDNHFIRLGTFRGAQGYDLTLWGGGRVDRPFQPEGVEGELVKQVHRLQAEMASYTGTITQLQQQRDQLNAQIRTLQKELAATKESLQQSVTSTSPGVKARKTTRVHMGKARL